MRTHSTIRPRLGWGLRRRLQSCEGPATHQPPAKREARSTPLAYVDALDLAAHVIERQVYVRDEAFPLGDVKTGGLCRATKE